MSNGTTIQMAAGTGGVGFDVWWAQQDQAAILAASDGWRGALNAEAFFFVIPAVCLLFAVGWLWSVFLIQLNVVRIHICMIDAPFVHMCNRGAEALPEVR